MRRFPSAAFALCALLAAASAGADPILASRPAVPPIESQHRLRAADAAPGSLQPEALVPTPWQIEGNGSNVKYGWSATTVGDVNADGYSDVVVTSDGATSSTGAAHLYLGGPGGLATSPVWSRTNYTLGPKAAPAGDVNGDGYGDFMVAWAEYLGTGGGLVNVYYGSYNGIPSGPFVRTATGGSVGYSFGTAGDVNGDGYDDVVVGAPTWDCGANDTGLMEIYYGSPSGLSLGNSASYCPNLPANSHFGFAVGSAGDINADGYGDVIVGAPDYYFDNGLGSVTSGYAAVYLGGPSGLGGTFQVPPIRMSAIQVGCRYGAAVATAGDFNGDGYSDVMVGAPNLGSSGVLEHGDLIIYGGSASPGVTLPVVWAGYDWAFYAHFGAVIAPAGDVNGDGYSDVVVSSPDIDGTYVDQGNVYVIYGRNGWATNIQTFYGAMAGEHFGSALGTAGDVDGDGFSDIMVGAYGWANPSFQEGRAVLYRGAADPPQPSATWFIEGSQWFENVGWSVAGAGDVNGDGYGDAIVGSWLWDSPGVWDAGNASLYLGGPSGLSYAASPVLEGDVSGAAFGFNVAGAGDVNGDGYEDVIVGQPYNGVDAAKIFPGGPGGLSSTPIWTGTGATGSGYGIVVSGAGDVNGDGYSDVLVGAPLDDSGGNDAGAAFLYLGGAGGPSTSPTRWFYGSQAGEHLGDAVACAGDLDADGYSDIVLGAPLYDAPGPIADAGRFLVYFGNAANVETNPRHDWWATGPIRFGSRLAGVGDVNGDGYSDLAVSCPTYSFSLTNQGRVMVYPGGPSGLGALPVWDIVGNETEGQLGWTLAGAGDVNADGRSDLMLGSYLMGSNDNGRVSVYTEVGSTNPFWTRSGPNNGDWFGFSSAGAGDVNGDGFADILVGAAAMEGNGAQDAGWALVFLGNLTNGDDGLDRRLRIRRADDSAPVAPRGRSQATNDVRLATLGRSAAGPTKLTMEYRLEPTGGGTVKTGTFGPLATTTGQDGAVAALAGNVTGLETGKRYEVRARVRSRSPYFPVTPWLSPVMDGREVMDFRTHPGSTDAPVAGLGGSLRLAVPRPNPSRGAVALDFALASAGHARFTIHDVAGREVARLADAEFAAGAHRVDWDGADAHGRAVAAGVYFARLTTPDGERVQRLVRMR